MSVRNLEARKPSPAAGRRPTQADRSARTRSALLESAARGISRYGYGNLVLEEVAREAGYTRGALYHQFEDKEDLALSVVAWVDETWRHEVGRPVAQEPDPVVALIALARGHAVFCRRDVARVVIALRLEFDARDHPVGREVKRVSETLVKRCARLIHAGRRAGSIPPGPPARAVALAFVGALEGTVIELAGHAPHDELLAARAAAGVLGLEGVPAPAATATPVAPATTAATAAPVRTATTAAPVTPAALAATATAAGAEPAMPAATATATATAPATTAAGAAPAMPAAVVVRRAKRRTV